MNKNDNVGKAVNVTEIKIIIIIKTKTKKKTKYVCICHDSCFGIDKLVATMFLPLKLLN